MTVRCRGVAPLTARREPWMEEVLADPDACAALLAEHGSPVNLVDTTPLARNAAELQSVADEFGVPLLVQVARKANKALAVVDEADRLGLGVDVGSERELRQVLDRGMDPARIVLTAAVKPERLLRLCLERGVLCALDNVDEAGLFAGLVDERGEGPVEVALRLAPLPDGGLAPSRFGEQGATWLTWLAEHPSVRVAGVHFHLHGYAAADRVTMLAPTLELVDGLRAAGHRARFVDVGGGIPMSYLDDGDEWAAFWRAHREALQTGEPITWRGHPLATVYPYHQQTTRGPWLRELLSSPAPVPGPAPVPAPQHRPGLILEHPARDASPAGCSKIELGGAPAPAPAPAPATATATEGHEHETVAEAFIRRGLELRCEPGRSMLDGCGMTLARVAFRKQTSDGLGLVGLEMNRTQCRSTSDDFMVDPVLLRPSTAGEPSGPVEAWLVGAYCIEAELILQRRLVFDDGVAVGDVVAIPNTGGYLMHILESASHQIPLARNLSRRTGEQVFTLDPIDA